VLAAHPIGRIGTPADIANLIAFLASDEAAFVTGAAWLIGGGLSAQFAHRAPNARSPSEPRMRCPYPDLGD